MHNGRDVRAVVRGARVSNGPAESDIGLDLGDARGVPRLAVARNALAAPPREAKRRRVGRDFLNQPNQSKRWISLPARLASSSGSCSVNSKLKPAPYPG